ncbi:hypothetical protein [Streptomyces albipurpureus]|uniref:Methyl-accepting chemotaxis protein n=1 Tax=Streptomyces albipurpureus TaxID=2897419 RepID=A0ABT0UZJ2_9ACTN|nr:hypothetical protein [Streptomyces sp. CWNU-1]MCM2393871.1 hypothetical protein [Streptomyces sp. CWNU-1]
MAGSDVPVAGPTASNPVQLADELRALADDVRVSVHRAALEELADDITAPERLARWAGTDLISAYAAPNVFLAVPASARAARSSAESRGTAPAVGPVGGGRSGGWPARRERWARSFSGWAGALVFLPLLVTWAGLGAAAWAYQRMREAGKGGTESFLALWQQGFAGELWAPFHFDVMVLYTVLALSGLIAATRLRSRQEQADDAASRLFTARLSGALAQVQALASGAAHMTPLRFAQELQGAASSLRTLGELAGSVQRETGELIEQARETAALTRSAAKALGEGVTGLRAAASAVEASANSASRAAEGAGRGAEVLSGEVVKVLDEMGRQVQESARTAAGQLAAAADDAVRRIADAADEAATHEENAVRQGVGLLDRTAEAMGGTVDAVRVALEGAVAELAGAADRLNGTVAALPEALEVSAADGAERIGWAYDRAVVALAVSLRGDANAVAGELGSQVDQLRELTRQREDAELSARMSREETEDGLRAATDDFRQTLHAVAALVEETTNRVVRSMPAAEPSPPADGPPRWGVAGHGAAGLDLSYDGTSLPGEASIEDEYPPDLDGFDEGERPGPGFPANDSFVPQFLPPDTNGHRPGYGYAPGVEPPLVAGFGDGGSGSAEGLAARTSAADGYGERRTGGRVPEEPVSDVDSPLDLPDFAEVGGFGPEWESPVGPVEGGVGQALESGWDEWDSQAPDDPTVQFDQRGTGDQRNTVSSDPVPLEQAEPWDAVPPGFRGSDGPRDAVPQGREGPPGRAFDTGRGDGSEDQAETEPVMGTGEDQR